MKNDFNLKPSRRFKGVARVSCARDGTNEREEGGAFTIKLRDFSIIYDPSENNSTSIPPLWSFKNLTGNIPYNLPDTTDR